MENRSLIRPRSLLTALMALMALVGAVQAAPGARGRDGVGPQGSGDSRTTAWVADDRDPAGDDSLRADPAEPDDRQSDALAASAGIPVPGHGLAGSVPAPSRSGTRSGDIGAHRARGPPAHRA